MKATSCLACLCVIPGWDTSGGAEGRGPHLSLVPGLSTCPPALSHPKAALTGAKGSFIAFSNSRSQFRYGIPLWRCPGMSHGCGSTKLAHWQVRPFAALALPGSIHTAGDRAMEQQGWAGLLGGLSLKSSCFLCLPATSRGPQQPRDSSTGTSSFLRLQLPGDTVKEKPPMSPPCLPGQASTGAFPISVHACSLIFGHCHPWGWCCSFCSQFRLQSSTCSQ